MKKILYLFSNWKMYLDYEESVGWAKRLSEEMKNLPAGVIPVVFPISLALARVGEVLKDSSIGIGAQNICWAQKGAFTGEISAPMVHSVGATYALIGHSERRHVFHETDQEVRQKIDSALTAGLIPVVCVGETLTEREGGKTDEVILAQLRAAFTNLTVPPSKTIVVAYEPVWAINTGKACEPREAERVHAVIKEFVTTPNVSLSEVSVVYGGSVTPENIEAFLAQESINGVLVGGSSVKPEAWFDLVSRLRA